jgi:hypothetical protein
MNSSALGRTLADLERTVRAIAAEFRTDTVFVIGSQAILAGWPDAPSALRGSPEIDAFPQNARIWEVSEKAKHPDAAPEASEHINALFGEGSQFHRTHGFFIDGVDDTTAKLPADWRHRAIVRDVAMLDGRVVRAVAPSPEDIVVSKLARLDDKDRDYIKAFHAARPLDPDVIEERIRASGMDSTIEDRALSFLRELVHGRIA